MLALGLSFLLVDLHCLAQTHKPLERGYWWLRRMFCRLSGWAAAAKTLSLMPLLVAALDFLWTPGHLWGLAMKKMKRVQNAGIPMLPVKVGLSKASQIVFLLNVVTVAFSFLFPLFGLTGQFTWDLPYLLEAAFFFKTEAYCFQLLKPTDSKYFLLQCPILRC